MATANIYAQRGDQATCETVLNTTRQLYTRYAAELQNGHVARVDVPSWRRQQIAAAVPVTDSPAAFRSDELVGAAVVNMEGEDLGSVEDIVMSPADGKVAYLVVSRGGIFGIGKKYVPVPWLDFKTAPGARLLVLATHKGTMDGAPQVRNDSFAAKGGYAAESMKVTDYWTANLTK
jgi:sporulation protein YlmC with PRC-barrel domain